MDKIEKNELLTGNFKKNLLKLALPTSLGFALQSVYDMVDMMWVGRISSSTVAGVTIFSTIFWIVVVLNEIIGASSISLITQSYGKKDFERTRRIIEQTLTFKVLVAIIAAIIISIILEPLLWFFSKDKAVVEAALDYGYIRMFFLPVMFASYSVNTALRCLGNAKTPMKIMIISSMTNIILDPIFMFKYIPGTDIPGFNFGVFGAALATVISTIIAFSIGLFILLKGNSKINITFKGLFKLDWEIDKKLLTIGFPTGIEVLMRNLASMATLKFVSIYGTNTVAAMGIGSKLFNFAFTPIIGISMGSSTIVGQALGADKIEKAKSTAKFAALVDVVMMGIVAIISIIIPEQIMKAFIDDPAVINIGIPMIRILIPSLTLAGFAIGLGCVFTGSGHNFPFLLASIFSRWCIQVPMLFVTSKLLNLSVIFVWLSFLAAEIGEIFVTLYHYNKGIWKTKRV
ncbi:MATE family efflux transporter [Schnuerera sp. xch1]|uniref:MATE family efflux transporter n=1 Tax=Schnuerera sp. xch1 TaxID=2874283 RepID=UPI001CBC2F89|nr:MATE family efflux transporter [Schnuerera sp. xch1]MBZ2176015.1 MATE family efflux transporter [Schnuerera sp. xch1]